MSSTTDTYDRGLTGFRALAATWVVLFHLNGFVGPEVIAIHPFGVEIELHPLVTVGWIGANLFFVLSGFLLTSRLMDRLAAKPAPEAVRGYLVARIRRVFPAYYAQIAVLFVVALATTRAIPDWVRFLPLNAFMLHNLSKDASWAINPVYWTLPIEFFFYLTLPFFAWVLLRGERAGGATRWRTLAFVVLGVLAVSWGYRVAIMRLFPGAPMDFRVWTLNQIPGTIDQFMIGGATGVALRWLRPAIDHWSAARRHRVSLALLVAGFAGIVGMIYFMDDIYDIFWIGHWALYTWYSITAAFISMAIAAISIGSPATRALFANAPVYFLGTISYSIYLWHFPIALWMHQAFDAPKLGLAMYLAYTLPPIVLASAVSYWLVERPFIARKGWTGRRGTLAMS